MCKTANCHLAAFFSDLYIVCPQLNMESASCWSKADKPNTTSTSKATATFLMPAGLLV
jgi:hypothetical protein